jgi:hypothetical protein
MTSIASLKSSNPNKYAHFIRFCQVDNIPIPEKEVVFFPGRRWRFDFAWREHKVAVEINGGIYTNGAHTRGAHYESDMEKLNHAMLEGWKVLQFTPKQLMSAETYTFIKKVLNGVRR